MPILLHSVQAVRTGQTYVLNAAATSTFATGGFTSPIVRISPQVGICYKVGSAAATTDVFLAAGVVEYIKVYPGAVLHAITATGGALDDGISIAEVIE